jgi:hypothetical protein
VDPRAITTDARPFGQTRDATALFYFAGDPITDPTTTTIALFRLPLSLLGKPLPLPANAPEKISYDFPRAHGLVADPTCAYFWAATADANPTAKLYVTDITPKTGPPPL